MQFRSFEPGIDVHGQSLNAIVEAFKLFPSMVLNILAKHGIAKVSASKQVVFDPNQWYAQDDWLAAFEAIAKNVGPTSLFDIGKHVPKHAQFPPSVKDIHTALQSIDLAYHMNHRKQGKVMLDPATGKMLEGIGHYFYEATPGARKITIVSENPYPCDFDHGLISAMATRFEPRATTVHLEPGPCRKRGERSCSYVTTW